MQSTIKHNLIWIYLTVGLAILIGFGCFYYFQYIKKITLIASGHPEWAPIMWQDGDKIVGAGPDLVNMICQDLKIKCDIKYKGQWQEVQDKARSGEVDMLVAAYKTDERQKYMYYSDAYTIDPITLFIKSGTILKYKNWEDLIGKKGVVMTGDSYGQEFDNYIKEKLSVESVPTTQDAFDRIISNGANYFVYCLYCGQRELKKLNLSGKVESIPDYLAVENFYITISKKSPFAKYLPKINELIKKYKNDGTIDRLVRQHEKLLK
ncbi:MAG: transporter substrate-binding domain-containing protein [Patescibacteria group bacterium]|nr:transporter substrate-binding domain-containing protein [Patescibacteria group bacterium]